MRFALLWVCWGKVRIFFIITVTFEEHWLVWITILLCSCACLPKSNALYKALYWTVLMHFYGGHREEKYFTRLLNLRSHDVSAETFCFSFLSIVCINSEKKTLQSWLFPFLLFCQCNDQTTVSKVVQRKRDSSGPQSINYTSAVGINFLRHVSKNRNLPTWA